MPDRQVKAHGKYISVFLEAGPGTRFTHLDVLADRQAQAHGGLRQCQTKAERVVREHRLLDQSHLLARLVEEWLREGNLNVRRHECVFRKGVHVSVTFRILGLSLRREGQERNVVTEKSLLNQSHFLDYLVEAGSREGKEYAQEVSARLRFVLVQKTRRRAMAV